MIAIEDIHWADPTSIELTRQLLPLTEQVPLLFVLTERLDAGGASSTFTQDGADEHLIRLEPLTQEAQAELVNALTNGHTIPPDIKQRLVSTAEGNPFFLGELVTSMLETGLVGTQHGSSDAHPVSVPDTVEKVVMARVDRLSDAARDVLGAASVLGRRVPHALLERLISNGSILPESLAELEQACLLSRVEDAPKREYAFRHALIQETVYESLLRRNRRELHKRAAEIIEETFPQQLGLHYGVLAHHLTAAGELQRALRYQVLAADAASHDYATAEALASFTAALELAAELDDDPTELYLRRGILNGQTSRLIDARADLEQALRLARAGGNRLIELRALNELGFLVAGAANYHDAVRLLEEALALAERLEEFSEMASALGRLSVAHTNLLELDRASAYCQHAVATATRAHDWRALALALDSLELVSVMVGDFPQVEQSAERLAALHREAGDLWYLQWTIYQSAWAAIGPARWTEALARLEEGLEIARRINDSVAVSVFLATFGWIYRSQGRYGQALAVGHEAVDLAQAAHHPEMTAWALGLLGWTLLDIGQVGQAEAHFGTAAQLAEAAGAQIQLVRAVSQRARALWLLGREAEACDQLARSQKLLDGIKAPSGKAYLQGADAPIAVARTQFEMHEPRRAEELLMPTLAAARAAPWYEFQGEAALALGQCLGDIQFIQEALAVAEAHGLPRLACDAYAALGQSSRAGALANELSATLTEEEDRATFLATRRVSP